MNATFTQRGSPSTLKAQLLMDQQAKLDIGQRIRELRDNSPETNRSIADYCDVGERSVAHWIAGNGISYGNVKKVAELFDVEFDWLWRGKEKSPTPDLMGQLAPSGSDEARAALASAHEKLDLLLAQVTALAVEIGKVQAGQQVQQALEQQAAQRREAQNS